VIKVIFKKKDRWSEIGNFPGKGGGSLGSLKYQVFPCQILSHNTFTNLCLSNLLIAQSKMKKKIYARKMESNKTLERNY